MQNLALTTHSGTGQGLPRFKSGRVPGVEGGEWTPAPTLSQESISSSHPLAKETLVFAS